MNCVNFCVLGEIVVSLLLGFTYIDRFINLIHPVERKLVPLQSPQVLILMVHETGSKAVMKSWIFFKKLQKVWRCLWHSLCVTHGIIRLPYNGFIAQCVRHQTLASTQAAGVIQVLPHANLAKRNACMTAKSIMDVELGPLFHIIIVDFGWPDLSLPKDQKDSVAPIAPQKLVHLDTSDSRTTLALKRLDMTASWILYTTSVLQTVWKKWPDTRPLRRKRKRFWRRTGEKKFSNVPSSDTTKSTFC